jgi:hypothetical protein
VRFLEKAAVPPYEGSMIRGAFGRAFKQSCCPFPHGNGSGCPLGDKCPYGYVFETSPPEGARDFARNQEVPRPYVFEPPEDTKMEYAPGERMRFGFTVVGRAADYMPYFIFAFSKMGEEGVGRLKARYELERVTAKPARRDARGNLRRRGGEESAAARLLGGRTKFCCEIPWRRESARTGALRLDQSTFEGLLVSRTLSPFR